MKLRKFLSVLWRQEASERGTYSCDLAVAKILESPELTSEAVVYAVKVLEGHVNKQLRGVLIGGSATGMRTVERATSELVESLIEHGMTLMDMRVGKRILGDSTPEQLTNYASQVIESGQTAIVRGRFVQAVAKACHRDGVLVRDQLSVSDLAVIRERVAGAYPDGARLLAAS